MDAAQNFEGEPGAFEGGPEVKAWLRNLELIYDAKGLNPQERFLHTLRLLKKSALKVYEYAHPTTYPQLCDMLVQRFSDKHDRFHKFQELVALRQGGGGLDSYMDQFMELHAQIPDMSTQDSLALYLGVLESAVRVHLLGAQHVATLERALEESRIFANAHRVLGYVLRGVRSFWMTR